MDNHYQEFEDIVEILKKASPEELHTIIIFIRAFLGER